MSPSNQERVFAKQYAVELLHIAEGDWQTALYLHDGLKNGLIRNENFFYLVQQTLEKLLKAVLVHLTLPVPLVYDLGVLLAKLPKSHEPPFGYEITQLSEFSAIRRYQESVLTWNEEEACKAVQLGETALAWAQAIINAEI